MYSYFSDTLERVSKRKAEKLYNMGFDVVCSPCKMRPEGSPFAMRYTANIARCNSDFIGFCNSFMYYNCSAETGRYISFYAPRKKIVIHLEFADGSNPYIYIYRGAPLACLEELARWNKCYNITLLKPHFYKLEVK